MAEIISNEKKGQKKPRRNIRIDLTPMVDLGFLLITFFVFTTTMSEAKVMEAMVPDDSDTTQDEICETCALTLIPDKGNSILYYEGKAENAMLKKISYSAEDLRTLIMNKKNKVQQLMYGDRLILIIKPTAAASFKNIVDIIDESAICRVKRYYIAELDETEMKMLP
jgi:biopolymer transport protein ExbD